MRKTMSKLFMLLASTSLLASCGEDSSSSLSTPPVSENSSTNENNSTPAPEEQTLLEKYDCLTVAEAIEVANNAGETPSDRQYVYGYVKEILNPTYGEMTIEFDGHELYVYGTYDASGDLRYSEMDEKPVAGDEVVLYATMSVFNNSPQIKSGWITEFIHHEPEFDIENYTEASVLEARTAEKGEKLLVDGVVSQITYANGFIPNGFILVDETSSIYVYDNQIASQVEEGNKIKLAATKDYWVLDSELNNANKFGYKGSCQLTSTYLLENDDKENPVDFSWVIETTIKDMMETPFTENVTSLVYKVNAYVKKEPGKDFVNYYINDIDGQTGTYSYTQCSGADFEWLDQYDGKIVTMYLTSLNAKSSASGCIWRFLPIAVTDEVFEFDKETTLDFVYEYYIENQFENMYTGDPVLTVNTNITNELIGIENVKISYSSSNTNSIYFETVEDELVMHGKDEGSSKVTITLTYQDKTLIKEIDITISKVDVSGSINLASAISAPLESEMLVRGIAGPSLVNRTGFYLIDETGVMAVYTDSETMASISLGNEVYMKGVKHRQVKEENVDRFYGQTVLNNATLVANAYGKHDYSTSSFVEGKTLKDLVESDVTKDLTTTVYKVSAKINLIETNFFTSISLIDTSGDEKIELSLFCSSANQYNFLKAYANSENPLELEIALCNHNDKTEYKGCVLSVIDPQTNEKIVNTLNYSK